MSAAPQPQPAPVRIERLDCWECDGPILHRTTPAPAGQLRHECCVCGAVWWSSPFPALWPSVPAIDDQ